MEVGRNLLSSPPSFPSRTHLILRNSLSSSSSSSSSSTSVLSQDHRDEFKSLLRLNRDDKTHQGVLNRRQIVCEPPLVHEDKTFQDSNNRLVWEFDRSSIHGPYFWHVSSSSFPRKPNVSSSFTMEIDRDFIDSELSDAIALAKKALVASEEAVSLIEESKLVGTESLVSSVGKEIGTVRSKRLLERRLKTRKMPKSKFLFPETQRCSTTRAVDARKKLNEGFDSDDPIRMFLSGPESKDLLTTEEESELVGRVQDLMKLDLIKARLRSEFARDPTMVEWAEAVGVSTRDLRSKIQSGTYGREKLVYANLRMVVHIAKQYQGRGVGIQDLMQEGSIGLMKSIEKFKPLAGCRFATYAYWWIRQGIRKSIFQHSRTIRLPENMYILLGKVLEAKRLCIQEGNRDPSQEQLARRVGITVEKLEKLLCTARSPISMQQLVWSDQDVTFQEVTADMSLEVPELSVTKLMMRKHVRGLLRVLNPRERQIIKLRYGIDNGFQKSLSEIGVIYGLSKERIRQLESGAIYKLKQSFDGQDLGAYSDFLI